ncbi:MAG: NAD-dependent epimerase [bacterium]|nr:NAD-dependent epimerase [bacterium]
MTTKKETVLVTGIAGFIGFHFAKKLLSLGYNILGVDNLNTYYDVDLKLARLRELGFSDEQLEKTQKTKVPVYAAGHDQFIFFPNDLENFATSQALFRSFSVDYVVNFAAQAGVRYSLENPFAYIDSNINGFMNILEGCRRKPVKHLVYASSSSVYGANETMPFSEQHNVDHPVSLYAATKKSNELMAHSYSHLYQIPTTGLRFFTVYGPWGRPDMAYFLFTKKILEGTPIQVFNQGEMKRDFTYIDDIVDGVYNVMLKIPKRSRKWDAENPDPSISSAPYRIFNIGNHKPVDLLYFIELLEKNLGKKALKELLPMQQGDVKETYADTKALRKYTGFRPETSIEKGIAEFVRWYVRYYETGK